MHPASVACPACERVSAGMRHCPWCDEPLPRRTGMATGVLIALAALLLALGAAQSTRAPRLLVSPLDHTGNKAPVRLAANLPRDVTRLPSSFSRNKHLGLTPAVLPLTALFIAVALFAQRRPVIHPYSWAAMGIALGHGRLGSAGDWTTALAALLATPVFLSVQCGKTSAKYLATPTGALSAESSSTCMPATSECMRINDAVQNRRRPSGMLYTLGVTILSAVVFALLLPRLRPIAGALVPHHRWAVLLLSVALLARSTTPGLPMRASLMVLPFSLVAMGVAGLIGWSGAQVAASGGVAWSPHALTLVLAGLFVLPRTDEQRQHGQAKGLPLACRDTASQCNHATLSTNSDSESAGIVARFLAGAANLMLPVTTPHLGFAALGAAGLRSADPLLMAAVPLGGFLVACAGGLGVHVGGGAWLAEAIRLPVTTRLLPYALLGCALASLGSRLMIRLPPAPSKMPNHRMLRPAYLVLAALAAGAHGLPGLLLLGSAVLAGLLPNRFCCPTASLLGFVLLPLALGAPCVAVP